MGKPKECLTGTVFDPRLGKCVLPTVFRTWDNGTTVALFPTQPIGSQDHVASFSHFQKHDDADYGHVISKTRPATKLEVKKLMDELKVSGYGDNIRVNKKKSHHWFKRKGKK